MLLQRVAKELFEESSKLSESINESPENFNHHDHPLFPPLRSECSIWYTWASVIVVIGAIISVIVILVHFCRLKRERSQSMDQICANIELQSDIERNNHTLSRNVTTFPSPMSTTSQNIVIQKY